MLTLLQQMVERRGLGDILAEGPQRAVAQFGEETAGAFQHVKGQLLPLHEPRFKVGLGLGYALSPTGADHIHNMHDPLYEDADAPSFANARVLGILEGVPAQELSPEKARLFTYISLYKSLFNSLDMCVFMPYDLERIVEQVRGVTGWDVSHWELLKASERALNMARAFNARAGLTAEDDVLPERMFQPLEEGALSGLSIDHDSFFETRDLAYGMLGWDQESGAPTRAKLYELGLGWAAKQMGDV